MSLSPFDQQEPWVLQSASADHPVCPGTPPSVPPAGSPQARARQLLEQGWREREQGSEDAARSLWARALRLSPHDLPLRRALNQLCPSLNRQPLPRRFSHPPGGCRVALLLPGQLRCLETSRLFLERLSHHADLFLCTEAVYRQAGESLRCRRHREILILEEDAALVAEDAALPVGSMRQWHKLSLALQMVRRRERRLGRQYTHLIKLRTDYFHVSPELFFEDLLGSATEGLATASDKVFGGPRDLMMLFDGFHRAIAGHFDDQEERYWPINAEVILRSDDSCKWYGMNWPERLVGAPPNVAELRSVLEAGGSTLASALAGFRPAPGERYLRLFEGHPRFASEVCFARFLLFCGIAWRQNKALRGFLRGDREKA